LPKASFIKVKLNLLQYFNLKYIGRFAFLSAMVFLTSCSTKKNTMVNRTYHNVTSYYNVYYNGNDAFKVGTKKINDSYKDNYSLLLPVFKHSSDEAVRDAFGDMNRAIEKGSKCVRKHSITEKPKRKEGKNQDKKDKEFFEQKQFVKWIDDAYLLIGKSQFYKHDFYAGIETFSYIVREYNDPAIKYEAYIWLARTYIEMAKFEKALDFLAKLETEKVLVPKSLIGPLALTEADLLIRQKDYEKAIPFMVEAVANTNKKNERARYLYILAQLYQKNEEKEKAYETFGRVVDLNQNYEMTFNSRINQASIFNGAAADSRPLQKELNKMLKDDKNIDYRDQIYYALGNIAFNESRDQDAIDYFLLSAHVSTQNNNQKGMSYLAAADIYFGKPDYRNSQAFYDSAISILSPEFPDYLLLKNKSQNLNELVKNLVVIESEDSLQRIALLPESQRNSFIDQLISKVVEEERKEKELAAQEQKEMVYLQQQGNEMRSQEGGSWYFYNQNMMVMGLQEFKKKWGDRKLEDNWRRKNKSVTSFDDLSEESSASADSNKQVFSNKSREYYLVGLPLTDSSMQLSKQRVEEAYFNLAGIYKERFNDFNQSIGGYLKLIELYPQTGYRLSSYYSLYKLFFLVKNYPKAEEYKAKILNEFPDSDYAKVLGNPDYFKELEKIDNQVKFMYQATYKYFLNNNCAEVQNNYQYVDSVFHESTLLSKFALLSALCEGNRGDTAALKQSLNLFKEKFPKSEEVAYADEVLTAMDRKPREIELAEKAKDEFGAELSTSKIDSIDLAIFKYNPQQIHYYLLVVSNKKASPNSVQFKVTNFNLDYYSFLEFDVGNELLSADYTCVVVKKFKNQSMANNYFESVIIAGEVLGDLTDDSYRSFIISAENYATFVQDKNLLKYQRFFEINYLKK
jgi:tetratricopeptide (TPR) repeat protein